MGFQEMNVTEWSFNPFEKIKKEWMLITAGDETKCNTMTASWGGVGIMWNENVVTVYIRPQRYTKEFVDQNEKFTISFLPEQYRKSLSICGSKSGRDTDKWKEAGLHPLYLEETAAVEEAELILVCKKLYQQEMKPECFIEDSYIGKCYPEKDFHISYIAKIDKIFVKK